MVFVFFTLRCAMLLAQLFVDCSEDVKANLLQVAGFEFLFLLLSAMWIL